MAHNNARRRRERQPPQSSGGAESYLPSQGNPFTPGNETARHRPDGISFRRPWGAGRRSGGDPHSRQEHDDEVEPTSRPHIIRRRVNSRTVRYQRQPSLGRESFGIEPTADGVVITEPPAPIPYTSSSESEGSRRAERYGVYGDQRNSQIPERGEPLPPRVARDEVIIERRDETRPFESMNSAVYGEPERVGYPFHRPASPALEDLDAFDDFHFVLPSEEKSKDAELSDLETPTTEGESSHKVQRPLSDFLNAPGIYSSSYSGTAELGAQHDVNLTVVHDPKGQKQPLFRWLHVRQEVLNFDALWVEVSRHIHLSEAERRAVANLRAEVKRQCVKTRYSPQGAKVGYMEPRCIQTPIQPTNKKTSDGPHTACWICIPYFSLHQYSESPSASNTALFPAQTLLQSQYSRSSQQRDMDQAVCQLGQVQRGECFHISQMWCLIVGNNALVTCGTMSQPDLQGATVKVNTEPSQVGGSGKILVSYGGAVMWSLTTKECLTWFAFIAHFHAFWPRNLEFWRKDRLITANNWDKILKLAEGQKGDVMLKLKVAEQEANEFIRDVPDVPRVFLKPDTIANKASKGRLEQSETPVEYLHVFTLLSKSAESSHDAILQDLHEQLSAAEKFLTEQTSYSAQRGYKKCELMTREGVHEYLTKLATRVEEKASDAVRRSYDERIDIFNMADMLFQLFFPITFQGPTTGKYWGALSKLMKIPELEGDNFRNSIPIPTYDMKNALWQLTRDIQPFQNIMSFSGKEDRAAIELPHELVTAWLHIVFGLIYSNHTLDWFGHMTKARQLMRDGMQMIIQGISNQNLLDKAVMLPTEVLSLVALNLLQDDVGKYDDICDTYSLYLNFLDTDITTKPSNRMYQHRIDLVKQEMTAIKRNLVRQRNIIAMLRNKTSITDGNFMVRYGEEMPRHMRRIRELDNGGRSEYGGPRRHVPGHRYYGGAEDRTAGPGVYDSERVGIQFLTDLDAASKLSSTDAGGFRSLFLADCANLIEQREYEFQRNTEYAEDLEREITYKMEWTKDKQENAIYAFTLVTIVFLPLSAISSIFGMNTNDIRNMDFDQWLYWVVALPVTVIIIIAGLWWMDELGNATDWLIGRRSRRSSEYGASSSSGARISKPSQPVMDSDSGSSRIEEPPVASRYRRARRRHSPIGRYTHNIEVVDALPPRRRRTSFYKY
ncbi:mg2+ transporter [Trichoderma arundinaceum]|uniref:Mg2+ transporter n=1 Tax=Trichoderma arundinaceum TaxID=490622 RepID=A0A395N7C3_TRIAR|nr:mg2+ transporter [Trichoderma arundinaceum]